MGVKFGMEEETFGPLLHAKFHPHRCNVSPLRGEKPQNRPLSKRNNGRFALRAMLPVIMFWFSKCLAHDNKSVHLHTKFSTRTTVRCVTLPATAFDLIRPWLNDRG